MPTSAPPPRLSRTAPASASVRSTQPTTPSTNGVAAAIASKRRVSSSVPTPAPRPCLRRRSHARAAQDRPGRSGAERLRRRRSSRDSRRRPGPRNAGARRRSRRDRRVAREQALGAQVVPEPGRKLELEQPHVLRDLRRRAAADEDARDRRMAERELQRRRGKRNARRAQTSAAGARVRRAPAARARSRSPSPPARMPLLKTPPAITAIPRSTQSGSSSPAAARSSGV